MKQKKEMVELVPPKPITTNITIEGISSLLANRRTAEMIKKKTVQEKDEEVQFEKALYPKMNGNHTFPSIAIKKATINAAHTFATSIPKTRARGAFDIPVDYIEIKGSEPTMRKDIAVNKPKGAIEIVRAEFKLPWKSTFPIVYDANGPLELNQIINLINIAGYYVGIGAWRPSCDGIHGRFKIVMK